MGDVADMMLDGILCESCGVFLNDEPQGYPCYCSDCATFKSKQKPKVKLSKNFKCTQCNRLFSCESNLKQHEAQMVRNGTHERILTKANK